MKIFSSYRDLPFEVYILFIARVINRMGDFVRAFLALFLTQKMGFSEKETGYVIMLVAASTMVGSVTGGKLGDSIGRKKVLLSTMVLFSVTLITAGFFVGSSVMPFLIIAASFFNGTERPLNTTIIADVTSGGNRARAFSLLYLGANIGVAVGPMIAGFLFKNFIQFMFWGDAATTLFAVFLIYKYVPETKATDEQMASAASSLPEGERCESGSVFHVLLRRPVLAIMTFLIIVSTFIYAQNSFTLPIYLSELFSDKSAKYYGFLMSVNAVVVVVLTPLIINITSKISPLRAIALSQLFYSIGFGMLYYGGGLNYFLISTVIWTLGEIITVTHFNVFVASHTPISHRSRINGILQFFFGAGRILSPVISGYWLESVGAAEIWKYIFFLAGGLFFLIFMLDYYDAFRNGKKKEESSL